MTENWMRQRLTATIDAIDAIGIAIGDGQLVLQYECDAVWKLLNPIRRAIREGVYESEPGILIGDPYQIGRLKDTLAKIMEHVDAVDRLGPEQADEKRMQLVLALKRVTAANQMVALMDWHPMPWQRLHYRA